MLLVQKLHEVLLLSGKQQRMTCRVEWLPGAAAGGRKSPSCKMSNSCHQSFTISPIWLMSFILYSCISFLSCKLPAKLYIHLKGI